MKVMPRLLTLSALAALGLAGALLMQTAQAADTTKSAILDTGRPPADQARDADRKPLEMLEFAQVKPGQAIADYMPGKGYFTRIFSNAVGPEGSVYAVTPQLLIDKFKDRALPPPVSAEAGHGNVHEVIANSEKFGPPGQLDLVWTSQNYHDVHIWTGAKGTGEVNKLIFNSLKPGGLYVVLDHAGVAGLDEATMAKLHRIDEALVIKEVTAAGFVLDDESKALRNPADPHDIAVFDAAIRGKTDQFILRFKKPVAK